MWELVWWRVTAHLTGSLSFLQMRSIQEATRGGTLLGGSYYFSITIETNTLAFSWSGPGVHWHQLSHYSKSWQNPKWISALWIMPICMLWHRKNKEASFFGTLFIMNTRWEKHSGRDMEGSSQVKTTAVYILRWEMQATGYQYVDSYLSCPRAV